MDYLAPLQILWDYLSLGKAPEPADLILGFGSFDDNVARRCAQLYREGYASRILFSGGLGRCTGRLFTGSEAARFADVAVECGVPRDAVLLEDRSTNTRENIQFSRTLLQNAGIPHGQVLGVHKPYMERRITAAMGVYWRELNFSVTSPQMTVEEYLADAPRQGMSREAAICVVVGDFQRIDLYAKKGYQLPQEIPDQAWQAYHKLLEMGYVQQLVK